jgi:ATP-binding cassette, subfamily B, bacterial
MKFQFKKILKDYVQILQIIYKASPGNAVSYFVLVLLQSVVPVLSLYITKEIIDIVTNPKEHDFNEIIKLVIGFCFLQLISSVCSQLATHVNALYQQKVGDYLSKRVLKKAISVDFAYYENPIYHDTLHLAQQQAVFKAGLLLNGFSNLLMQFSSVIMIASMLVFYYWQYAVIIVLLSLPLFAVKWFFSRKSFQEEKKLTTTERESNYLQQVLTGISFAKEVRLFGFGKEFISRYSILREYLFKQRKDIQNKQNLYSVIIEAGEIILVGFIFFSLAKNTWEQLITPGLFVIYLQGFQKLQSGTKSFLTALVQLFQHRMFINHLFMFLDIPENDTDVQLVPFPSKPSKLEISNLNFSYPDTEKQVLNNISLSCTKGQIIAIVGANGSGKSTLVKILGKLYNYKEGSIAIDGISLNNIDKKEFSSNSVFLFQDFEKYFLSVSENISLGAKETNDLALMNKAANNSGANLFIDKMKRGFDTKLGRAFWRGEQLSGGEWQKLALARLFYRDADLVVMDEPTSALDALSESELFNSLRDWGKEKIIILVSHRLFQLKKADVIFVMKNGSIVEQGNFDELIAHKSYFCEMFETQL